MKVRSSSESHGIYRSMKVSVSDPSPYYQRNKKSNLPMMPWIYGLVFKSKSRLHTAYLPHTTDDTSRHEYVLHDCFQCLCYLWGRGRKESRIRFRSALKKIEVARADPGGAAGPRTSAHWRSDCLRYWNRIIHIFCCSAYSTFEEEAKYNRLDEKKHHLIAYIIGDSPASKSRREHSQNLYSSLLSAAFLV